MSRTGRCDISRFWAVVATVCLLFCFAPIPAQAAGSGTVVIEALTGRVLYEENAQARLPMASTTKIMTALLTLEQPGLDESFQVDGKSVLVEGTSMGLRQGDTVTLRTLATGMLLASGNDAANAAAVRISGSVAAFVEKMNQRAQELGLTDTHFETPSGLDGASHYSTPKDMALLAAAALKNLDFSAICSQSSLRVEFGSPPGAVTLYNHNRLLREYEGCIGVKTGFTKKAGRCLVSAAQRDGVTLICVTLGVYDDWNQHKTLLDRCFPMVSSRTLSSALLPGILPVAGEGRSLSLSLQGEPVLPYLEGDPEPKEELFLPPFLYPSVQPGETVGWIRWKVEGREVLRLPVIVKAE